MRSYDATVLLLTSLCLLFLESQMVVARPFSASQLLSDELQEYLDNSDTQYLETAKSRSPRESFLYNNYRGKKSEGMSASDILNQLYNIVRARGESSGKIKAMRFGISKR